MRTATLLLAVACFAAAALLSLPVLAFGGYELAVFVAAQAPAVDPKLLNIAAHAAGIAVAIRGLVALLKSPIGGLLWLKVPTPVRLLVLAVLCAIAVGAESLAVGKPLAEAIFVAIGGLGAAITTREIQASLTAKRR